MYRQLEELREVAQFLSNMQGIVFPILCAGDIFDKWNPPTELVNFAIEKLKHDRFQIYAVPGQHDMCNHSHDEMGKTGYSLLRWAGAIRCVDHERMCWLENDKSDWISVAGYGWQTASLRGRVETCGIALLHRYVWNDKNKFYGAEKSNADGKTSRVAKEFQDNLIICGDNHKGFYDPKYRVFNCGGFYRRNSDQVDYTPQIGIVYSDYTVRPYQMDTSKDKWLSRHELIEVAETDANLKDFLKDLKRGLSVESTSFKHIVESYCRNHGICPSVQSILMRIIDNEQ